MTARPDFTSIASFGEFSEFYRYRAELAEICRQLGLPHTGTKAELVHVIRAYFEGGDVPASAPARVENTVEPAPDSPLLKCGFSFNARFRRYFARITGVENFKFTADMAAAWRRVKREGDMSFTVGDMLDVYYGRSERDSYDASSCQWNRFLADFSADGDTRAYSPRLKAAALRAQVRASRG